MTTDEKLIALEERIAQLESALARQHHPSIKRDKQCGCGGRNILRVADLRVANGAHLVLHQGLVFDVGHVVAYVCKACHRIELYGTEVDQLELDGEITAYATDADAPVAPDTGPYR